MRLLICGGRDFCDYDKLEKTLSWFHRISAICHGGAKGADTLVHRFMQENFQKEGAHITGEPWEIEYGVFRADWYSHGKAAGMIRNAEMLSEFKPDLVIAFPGGVGTKHMVEHAKAKGYSVLEVK